MKTYLECGITLRGSEAQSGATHIHLLKQDIFCEGSERLLTPAILSAALALLMVVRVAEFLIGLVGNEVLVVWSFGEWVRKFNESLYNLIVPGLAVCRFLLWWLIMMDLTLFPLFQSSHWLHYLSVFWILVSQASLWFATFLSIFYCRKITALEHPVCLWLKQRAYHLSLWCLLGYLMINLLLVAHISVTSKILPKATTAFCAPFQTGTTCTY